MAKSGVSSAHGPRRTKASEDTQRSLVLAAIESLKQDGFAGSSARSIARRAGCNQGLVFYHFGSVANLLLAALDAVSADRLARYGAEAASPSEMARLAGVIFDEDLDAGYATVLVELISGAHSIPGFGAEVATRLKTWTDFAQTAVESTIDPMLLALVAPPKEVAYAIVAMYLGLEMLSHLDGDRTNALALFGRATNLISLLDTLGVLDHPTPEEPE